MNDRPDDPEGDGGLIVAPIRMGLDRPGLFKRLSKGLSRSSRELSEQVVQVFTMKKLDQEALDQLEEMLIEADLGPAAAARVTKGVAKLVPASLSTMCPVARRRTT